MYTGAENETIQGLINAFLVIIPAGVAARSAFCALSMIHDDEERGKIKSRMKNTVCFGIVAELAAVIVNLAYHYYS